MLIDTPDLLWIYSQKQDGVVIEKSDMWNACEAEFAKFSEFASIPPDVIYDGHIKVVIENTAIRAVLRFTNCKSVFLINCTANKPLLFDSVSDVTIDRCCIDFNREEQPYALYVAKVSSVLVTSCKSSNMVFASNAFLEYRDCDEWGILIEKSSFFNLSNPNGCIILSPHKGDYQPDLKIRNCDFTNCSDLCLLPPTIKGELEGNTYSNCCRTEAM